jgi:hypothetical protein
VAAGHVVIEDAAHDGSFGFEHLEMGRSLGVASDAPVGVGSLPRRDFTDSRCAAECARSIASYLVDVGER